MRAISKLSFGTEDLPKQLALFFWLLQYCYPLLSKSQTLCSMTIFNHLTVRTDNIPQPNLKLKDISQTPMGEGTWASVPLNKRKHMLVIGESLLRAVEAQVGWPNFSSQEVCCLSGVHIQDVTERIKRLIKLITCSCSSMWERMILPGKVWNTVTGCDWL